MPTKSQKQIKKSGRIAARGAVDLESGNLTPRALRVALDKGRYEMLRGRPPAPPVEWRAWKRERFALCIKAAHLFLRGKELDQIGPLIGKGTVGEEVTRQWISAMVGEGVRFLLDRRFVRAL
jgi:hypothetical protein